MTIDFNKWPWKLNWAQRIYFRLSATYRCAVKAVRREETASAWEASGRSYGKDHPGFAPGSAEDVAYMASEAERRQRSEVMWAAQPSDPSIRDDIKAAIVELQNKADQA